MARGLRLALALGSVALAGCVTEISDLGPPTCERSIEENPPVLYTEGVVTDGVYATSAADGELLHYPGGMHYELAHGLGRVPTTTQFLLSFDRYGTRDDGSLAEATGNQAEIVRVDAETLVVKNNSCVEYWLLAIAE